MHLWIWVYLWISTKHLWIWYGCAIPYPVHGNPGNDPSNDPSKINPCCLWVELEMENRNGKLENECDNIYLKWYARLLLLKENNNSNVTCLIVYSFWRCRYSENGFTATHLRGTISTCNLYRWRSSCFTVQSPRIPDPKVSWRAWYTLFVHNRVIDSKQTFNDTEPFSLSYCCPFSHS